MVIAKIRSKLPSTASPMSGTSSFSSLGRIYWQNKIKPADHSKEKVDPAKERGRSENVTGVPGKYCETE